MTEDFKAAFDGLDPATIEAISKPEVMERFASLVEKAKEPVLNKNNDVLGQLTALKSEVNSLGGIDAIKALRGEAEAKSREAQEALAKSGNVDAIRAQFEATLREKDEALTSLQQSMVKEKTGSAIAKALREAGAETDLLFPHMQKRITAELKDGKVVLTPLGTDGQPLVTKDMKQGSIKDLVAELQGVYPSAFKAQVVTGSGAVASGSTAAGIKNPWMPETRNFMEQNRIAIDDPKKAMQLAALAGVNIKL